VPITNNASHKKIILRHLFLVFFYCRITKFFASIVSTRSVQSQPKHCTTLHFFSKYSVIVAVILCSSMEPGKDFSHSFSCTSTHYHENQTLPLLYLHHRLRTILGIVRLFDNLGRTNNYNQYLGQ
jgi:hypothetical protein